MAFARKGAALVLEVRREEQLRQVVDACRQLGGQALAVPTDVTDERAMHYLAQRAIESYGRLDVWINNAAVSLFGRIDETPMEDYRRVIETSYLGYVHGARAALPYFCEQGRGVLINNSLVFGTMGAPYLSAYVSTKFAISGLSECLRQELLDAPGIQVCTIRPASMDTPIFNQAANYTGRAIKPLRPIYSAGQVAQGMVQLAQKPQRELFIGNAGRMQHLMRTLMPGMAEKMFAKQVKTDHFQEKPANPSSGNVHQPMPQWNSISGGWKGGEQQGRRGMIAAGMAALALAGLIWRRSRSDSGSMLPFRQNKLRA